MSHTIRPVAAVFFLGALSCSPGWAAGQLPEHGDRYAWASVAYFAAMMQACAEAYPSRKAGYQYELRQFIVEMFDDSAAVRQTYDTMMATEDIKELNRKIIAGITQGITESEAKRAEFEQMCGLRPPNPPPPDTPETRQAQRELRLRGHLTQISTRAAYVYATDKAYGTAPNPSGSCVGAAAGSLFSRAGHPPPEDRKVNPNRYSNVVLSVEGFMREAGTTEIFCYSTPERYAIAARIPGKTMYDCVDSSGQSVEIANRITGPSCDVVER
jgi:hypothetical protein